MAKVGKVWAAVGLCERVGENEEHNYLCPLVFLNFLIDFLKVLILIVGSHLCHVSRSYEINWKCPFSLQMEKIRTPILSLSFQSGP